MFQQQLLTGSDLGDLGGEEDEEGQNGQQQMIEEETTTIEMIDPNQLPIDQEQDPSDEEDGQQVLGRSSSVFEDEEEVYENEEYESVVSSSGFQQQITFQSKLAPSGTQRPPIVIFRSSGGGGIVSTSAAAGSAATKQSAISVGGRQEVECAQPSVGQYVMRGGQMVRIGSHPAAPSASSVVSTRQNSTAATTFFNSASGSPVKVVRIMPESKKSSSAAYQRVPGSGQPLVVQQASPTSQAHGTVLIKGAADPKGVYRTGNQQIQYVRLVQPSTKQGTNSKQTLKPIAPSVTNPISTSADGSQIVLHGPRESGFVGEQRGVPPATAIVVKKKARLGHRKPCNCTKSMCLKLYCDCFANGEFCRNCNCKDCHNNLEYDDERSKAIKTSLDRNPQAFQPKIGKTGRSEIDRMHQKGCHCKKSSCLKNYCECYEAKVSCTLRCKCVGCRNTEQDRQSKGGPKLTPSAGLLHLANAASSASAELNRSDSPPLSEHVEEQKDPKTMPWFYMTDEVVECTTLCLVAQAEELERSGGAEEGEMEKAILKEFGRCLEQIIQNAAAASSS